jgi:hypothetical protein
VASAGLVADAATSLHCSALTIFTNSLEYHSLPTALINTKLIVRDGSQSFLIRFKSLCNMISKNSILCLYVLKIKEYVVYETLRNFQARMDIKMGVVM